MKRTYQKPKIEVVCVNMRPMMQIVSQSTTSLKMKYKEDEYVDDSYEAL